MEKYISAEKYDRQYFEKLNKGYQEFISKDKLHPAYYRAVDFVGLKEGDTVLDVGCGRGEMVYLCARKGHKSVGVDFSNAAIGMAKEFLKSLPKDHQKNVRILKEDAKDLSFEADSFDVVFMLDLVEHLYDWELKAVFYECWRVLKPSGRLLIYTSPNKLSMQPVRFLAHLFGVSLRSDEFHVNEQSFFSLKNYLKGRFSIQKFWMQKHDTYWFDGVPERSFLVKFVTKAVDFLLDNPFSKTLITKTFLRYFLGTGIWIVAGVRKK